MIAAITIVTTRMVSKNMALSPECTQVKCSVDVVHTDGRHLRIAITDMDKVYDILWSLATVAGYFCWAGCVNLLLGGTVFHCMDCSMLDCLQPFQVMSAAGLNVLRVVYWCSMLGDMHFILWFAL